MVFCNIELICKFLKKGSHNPYFNRWFSAMKTLLLIDDFNHGVTILILIDGFLQYLRSGGMIFCDRVTILILIDGFLQYT